MDHVLVDCNPEAEDNNAGTVSSSGWSKAMVVPIEARLRLLAIGILYEVCRVQKFTMSDLSESNFLCGMSANGVPQKIWALIHHDRDL
jgi:hypothetical protein